MSVQVIVGSKILDHDPTPVKTGYTLTGWAYAANGTGAVGANDLVSEDDTIYAVWTEDGE